MASWQQWEVPMRFALRIPGDGRFTQRRLARQGGSAGEAPLMAMQVALVSPVSHLPFW